MVIDFQGKGDNEQLVCVFFVFFFFYEPLLGSKLLCFDSWNSCRTCELWNNLSKKNSLFTWLWCFQSADDDDDDDDDDDGDDDDGDDDDDDDDHDHDQISWALVNRNAPECNNAKSTGYP